MLPEVAQLRAAAQKVVALCREAQDEHAPAGAVQAVQDTARRVAHLCVQNVNAREILLNPAFGVLHRLGLSKEAMQKDDGSKLRRQRLRREHREHRKQR